MKKLQVIVQDKNSLVLMEDGQKGDLISLNELANVDLSQIEELISSGKDQVYEKKLEEVRKAHSDEIKKQLTIQELELNKVYKAKIEELEKKNTEQAFKDKLNAQEIQQAYELRLNKKNEEINLLNETLKDKIEKEKLAIEKLFQDRINDLNNKLSALENKHEIELMKKKNEYDAVVNELKAKYALNESLKKNEYETQINELKLQFNETIREKEAIIADKDLKFNELQNRKAATNVKLIGEGLEDWCNKEMESYMQNGFLNCQWYKDTQSIRLEDESKGTKADYIFKIYANNDLKEEDLLTAVCLEMKDENPNSKNKQKNSVHYAKLDTDRTKKGCKYAILVSNLEADNPNDIPIYKVREYPDMYVVRPGYMIVLLNMITSLTTNFKDLLLQANQEKLEMKSKLEFLAEFESLKQSYLENNLISLEKNLTSIKKASAKIIESAEEVDATCNKIIATYINVIQSKLDTFTTKITREYKKFEKKSL